MLAIKLLFCVTLSSLLTSSTGDRLDDSVTMLRDNMVTVRNYAGKLEREYKAFSQKVYGHCASCKWIKNHHEDYCDCQDFEPRQDCLAFKRAGFNTSGVYKINGPHFSVISTYCDQTTQGGGWTVFQRRQDGFANFQRDWLGYKSGFGKLSGEFWFGNDKLHDLTNARVAPKKSELLINMRMRGIHHSMPSKYVFAACNGFEVGNENSKYLLSLGKLHGNVSNPNAFWYHNHRQFSTMDNDNDHSQSNCSGERKNVGWWFGDCYNTLLNGVYSFNRQHGEHGEIMWDQKNQEQPDFVEMKFRRIL